MQQRQPIEVRKPRKVGIAQNMAELATKSNLILMETQAVFPFDIFPDKVVVKIDRIDIVTNYFFYSRQVFPIFIKDLQTVEIETNPFFAILIFDLVFTDRNPAPISYLPKNEATTARRLILGLIAANKDNIDMSNLSPNQIIQEALKIGTTERVS